MIVVWNGPRSREGGLGENVESVGGLLHLLAFWVDYGTSRVGPKPTFRKVRDGSYRILGPVYPVGEGGILCNLLPALSPHPSLGYPLFSDALENPLGR